jgi:hypothetical protein
MNSCSSKYSDIQNKLNELQKEVEKRATLITVKFDTISQFYLGYVSNLNYRSGCCC